MSIAHENKSFISEFVTDRLNLPVFGIAPIESILETIDGEIRQVVDQVEYAIVLGHPLCVGVLETIDDRPTILYKHHYQQTNWRLDRAALELAVAIETRGYKAVPIPASVITDWKNQRGHLSHRHAAIAAGLGWKGRHGLVVNPEYGSQIRWVTILTDMFLAPDNPLELDCGSCRDCIGVCPADAIDINGCDVRKCFDKLKEFSKLQGVGQYICGVCIKACSGKNNG